MHNSENIISYSATVSLLVGVFRSLNYVQVLSSAALLDQAVPKVSSEYERSMVNAHCEAQPRRHSLIG